MLLKSNFLAGLFFKGKFELNLTLTHNNLYRFEYPWLKKKLGHSILVSLTTYKITFHLKGTQKWYLTMRETKEIQINRKGTRMVEDGKYINTDYKRQT